MSLLVTLPHHLLHPIVSSWLELHNIAKLDTAYCCRSFREAFLNATFSERIVFATDQYIERTTARSYELSDDQSDAFMKWVLKRKAVISNLAISPALRRDAIFRIELLNFLGEHITRVVWTRCWTTDNDYLDVIYDLCEWCPNVKLVECSGDFNAKAYERIAKNWPLLSSLDVGYGAKEGDISIIGRHCKNLTSIGLHGAELSSKTICQLLKHAGASLRKLHGLKLPAGNGADEVVRAIARYCPELREIGMEGAGLDLSWDEVVRSCPHLNDFFMRTRAGSSAMCAAALCGAKLEHFSVLTKFELDSYAMKHLVQSCHNLRSLTVFDQYARIDDAALVAAAENCPQLETLKLLWLNATRTSDHAAYALAKGCRKLTHLELPGMGLTDAGLLAILAVNPGIEFLNVHNCQGVTDKSMKAIPQLCPYMIELTTYKCKVKIAGVHAILQGCRHLRCFQVPAHLLKKAQEALERYKHIYRPGLQISKGAYVVLFGD